MMIWGLSAEVCGMQGVYIPKMRADLTTEKVLIMEWVDGKRLRSAGKRRAGVLSSNICPRQGKLPSLMPRQGSR